MRNKEDVAMDLAQYFAREAELSLEERKRLLTSLFEKHYVFNMTDFKIDFSDLQQIRNQTSTMYATQGINVKMSRKTLSDQETVQLFLLENFIGFLNNKGALKRMPKFDKE